MKQLALFLLISVSTLFAKRVSIDFDADGAEDIALIGGNGWNTLPVYLQKSFWNGSAGPWTLTNFDVGGFESWARDIGVTIIPGDFNGDGKTDIALVGGGWNTTPVAFSNGDGSFRVTNLPNSTFANWAHGHGAWVIPGDFNGDGKMDIALVGGSTWSSIPIAFSNGDGTFNVQNYSSPTFVSWAQVSNITIKGGDFDGDGKTDIAIFNGTTWSTIPIAYSNGNGTFDVRNISVPDFASWSARTGTGRFVGDFNGDGRTDLCLLNGGWSSIPVATAGARGTLTVTNADVGSFGRWAGAARQVIIADIGKDGMDDILLTGGSGWGSAPYARSTGGGNFSVTNPPYNTGFPAPIPSSAAMVPICCQYNSSHKWELEMYEINSGYTGYPGEYDIPAVYFEPNSGIFQWQAFRGQSVTDINNFANWSSDTGARIVNNYTYCY